MKDATLAEKPATSVRDRIDKLHALLTEALSIEAKITGDEPAEKCPEAKPEDIALDVIEDDLDRALGKTRTVVRQLHRIQSRL